MMERRNETKDIVKRLGFISPKRVRIKNFEIENPKAIFNGSLILDGNKVDVYTRIVIGYYQYISGICQFSLDISDIYNLNSKHFDLELLIYPDNVYDLFGAEDPRVQKINGKTVVCYAGRTSNYFSGKFEKVVPIVATTENNKIMKKALYTKNKFVSNKNAVLLKTRNKLYVLFRPEVKNNDFCLWYGELDEEQVFNASEDLSKMYIERPEMVLHPSKFEKKVGWATPPIEVDGEYLLFVHSKGMDEVYRVFAIALTENKHGLEVSSTTPCYIMEPKEIYEKFGDRPFVVFPCGAVLIDDKIVISYGASDMFLAFGEVEVSSLLSLLDKNRNF